MHELALPAPGAALKLTQIHCCVAVTQIAAYLAQLENEERHGMAKEEKRTRKFRTLGLWQRPGSSRDHFFVFLLLKRDGSAQGRKRRSGLCSCLTEQAGVGPTDRSFVVEGSVAQPSGMEVNDLRVQEHAAKTLQRAPWPGLVLLLCLHTVCMSGTIPRSAREWPKRTRKPRNSARGTE